MSDLYEAKAAALRYDTARELPADTLRLWRDTLRRELPVENITRVLDLGGGTGRFAAMLREAFGGPVTVVEPSAEMLSRGRGLGLAGVDFIPGAAEKVPLASGAADLVWMSQVFHHLDNVPAALREVKRLLRPGGFLVVRNGTQETDEVMVWKPCFPEAKIFDEGRIPTRAQVVAAVTAAGLRLVKQTTVYQRFAASARDHCEKISARGLSALKALPDEAFEAGVGRLRAWAESQPMGKPVDEPVDVWFFQKGR